MARKRVLILHPSIVPYRTPLFSELAEKYDLTVWFGRKQEPHRSWNADIGEVNFGFRVLKSRALYGLVLAGPQWRQLKQGKWDLIIFADNFENIFNILEIVAFGLIRNTPVVAWSEHVLMSPSAKRIYLREAPRLESFRFLITRSIHKQIRKRVYKIVSAILSMCQTASNHELDSIGVPHEKRWTGTQVMPMADGGFDRLEEKRRINLVKHDTPGVTLLYLGYFRPEKNIMSLLNAFTANPPCTTG